MGVDEIVAFIAIRAKVYSLISISNKNGKDFIEILNKLKGVNRAAVEALGIIYNSIIYLLIVIFIGFYRYLLCVLLSIPTDAEFVKLSSKGHNIRMEQITKMALRNFGKFKNILKYYLSILFPDDKCRIMTCGIHTKIYAQELSDEMRDDTCYMCEWQQYKSSDIVNLIYLFSIVVTV